MLALLAGTSIPAGAQAHVAPFGYDRSQPLAVESAAVDGQPRMFRVSFASGANVRARGMLALPDSAGRRPAVILMHGLPGNAQGAISFLGRDLASRGAVVLAIDAPWAQRGGMPDFTVRDSVEQVQLMIDLQRAVDFLVARADVDPTRIGYVGGSYGGAMGALFVAIEPRLRAANLFVPDGGLVAHFTDASGSAIGPLATIPTADQARWLAAMRPIEPLRFVARASIPLLLQNGRLDPLVTVEDAQELHAAAGGAKEILWYDAGHGLGALAAAKADRARFFNQHLGIPSP